MDELTIWATVLVVLACSFVGSALGTALWALTYGRRDRERTARPRLIELTPHGRIELDAGVTDDELAAWLAVRGGPPPPVQGDLR